ncbi:MAG TPA: extracellular solute-binding protein [Gaiellaceae bacterium]|nr:extracellular solute-binding protein [Gaiellaceae bacterium]
MKVRLIAAVVICACLALSAATATGRTAQTSPSKASATTLTVWLQEDARDNWPGVVNSTNQAFERAHPDVNVKVEYQTWNQHLAKFDATIAGNNVPDVIEMGNTEMTKYMDAKAFWDITSKKRNIPNSKTWLKGLEDSARLGGKLYGVPYWAGARAVIYRKDLYRGAGVRKLPSSLAEYEAVNRKLMKRYGGDRRFSALYFPGQYWLAAMSFVYDYGGAIAKFKNGKWAGTLDSPQAIKALTIVKRLVSRYSRASKTGDEANPFQAVVFGQGKVGSIIANGWEWGLALDTKKYSSKLKESQLGAFPMPSHIKGKYMPTFLGGSDLAIPVQSNSRSLALEWIKAFTSNSSMSQLATQGKVIPNTTSLLRLHNRTPSLAPFARASRSSWFVPTAKNWVNVESARTIRTMLVRIFSNRHSVKSAAQRASKEITSILNAKS